MREIIFQGTHRTVNACNKATAAVFVIRVKDDESGGEDLSQFSENSGIGEACLFYYVWGRLACPVLLDCH